MRRNVPSACWEIHFSKGVQAHSSVFLSGPSVATTQTHKSSLFPAPSSHVAPDLQSVLSGLLHSLVITNSGPGTLVTLTAAQ